MNNDGADSIALKRFNTQAVSIAFQFRTKILLFNVLNGKRPTSLQC